MTSPSEAKVLVIGVGNPLRGDDAAGVQAAKLIRDLNHPSIHVIEHDGEGASLTEAWTGGHMVIVVDAASSNSPPGTIYRFDATQQPLPEKPFQRSTHAFGLYEAVELSRALNRLPRRLIIYGIRVKSLEIGASLSDEVGKSVCEVVERILEEPPVRAYNWAHFRLPPD
jgi:hydrogenase maturation protease